MTAIEHAARAERLLEEALGRGDRGAMYGAVKAEAATAHALLALFHQKEEDR